MLLIYAIRHPRWFAACVKASWAMVNGRLSFEGYENELKLAGQRYNVDFHTFEE